MKKLFLPVFADAKFEKQIFFNVTQIQKTRIVIDAGEYLRIEIESVGGAFAVVYLMVNEWNDFMREHVLGVPRRTLAADIHLGAIADGVSDLVACFKK